MTDSAFPRFSGSFMVTMGLLPFASVALVAALTGMHAITVVTASLAALGAMAAAGTFVMAWEPDRGQSRWRSRFILWISEPRPNRLQHWYVPVCAAAGGGLLGELIRIVLGFWSAGAPLSWEDGLLAAAVGALEGLLVALAFGVGYGLIGFVRPRFAKRAT